MKISNIILKILMPLLLGAAILYWMYRGENWHEIWHVMTDEMNWTVGFVAQSVAHGEFRLLLSVDGHFLLAAVAQINSGTQQ